MKSAVARFPDVVAARSFWDRRKYIPVGSVKNILFFTVLKTVLDRRASPSDGGKHIPLTSKGSGASKDILGNVKNRDVFYVALQGCTCGRSPKYLLKRHSPYATPSI